MTDISKLTKKQLLDVLEQQEDNRWDDFKEEFGLTYNTADEWIEETKFSLTNYNQLHTRG